MIKNYPAQHVDVTLIALSEMDIGVRTLSSFLKEKGFRVLLGLFPGWEESDREGLERIREWVRETDPAVIGVSTVEFARSKAAALISLLREEGRTVVAGGIDATLNPDYYFARADYVVRGEGEHALRELLEALRGGKELRGIRNLWYRDKDGRETRNGMRPPVEELDELPPEDLLDLAHHFELTGGRVRRKQGFAVDMPYEGYRARAVFLVASRGCVFRCAYCSSHRLYPEGTRFRKRSARSIIGRMAQLRAADPSINMAYFFDDDFFLRTRGEIEEFAAGWREKVGLPFYVFCSPVTLAEDKLAALVDAGLMVVNMGIQSGSERINFEVYDRKMPNRSAVEAAALLRKYAGRGRPGFLPPVYDLIINNPYETEQDLLETIRLFTRLPKPYFMFMYSLALYQGTRLYETAVRDGMLAGRDESTQYNFNDTLRHFNYLIRRGGNYYLNSLLYWMNGHHRENRYGIVPGWLLGALTGRRAIRFFNRRPGLIAFLNAALPTHKNLLHLKLKLKGYFAERAGSLREALLIRK